MIQLQQKSVNFAIIRFVPSNHLVLWLDSHSLLNYCQEGLIAIQQGLFQATSAIQCRILKNSLLPQLASQMVWLGITSNLTEKIYMLSIIPFHLHLAWNQEPKIIVCMQSQQLFVQSWGWWSSGKDRPPHGYKYCTQKSTQLMMTSDICCKKSNNNRVDVSETRK